MGFIRTFTFAVSARYRSVSGRVKVTVAIPSPFILQRPEVLSMDNTFAFDDLYDTSDAFGQFGQSAKFGLPYTLSMSCRCV